MSTESASKVEECLGKIAKASWRKDSDKIVSQFKDSVSNMKPVINILTNLGFKGVKDADVHLDTAYATDLVDEAGHHIAVRIRTSAYSKFSGEFTIRSRYPASYPGDSSKTEMSKIMKGCADLALYGFSDDKGGISSWTLLNLDVFRETLACEGFDYLQARCPATKRNPTDGIVFSVFKISDFPGTLVLASSN